MANVPDYGVEEVADSALSLILNLVGAPHHISSPPPTRALLGGGHSPHKRLPRRCAQMRKTHALANGTKENKWPTHAAKGGEARPLLAGALFCV